LLALLTINRGDSADSILSFQTVLKTEKHESLLAESILRIVCIVSTDLNATIFESDVHSNIKGKGFQNDGVGNAQNFTLVPAKSLAPEDW
jgi:hypothetical protein